MVTAGFLPGTTFTLPDAGWFNTEDEPGEFNLRLRAHPIAVIIFFIDPVPLKGGVVQVHNVPQTPEGILGWLQHHRYITVSRVEKTRLAGDAAAVTFRVAYDSDYPSCPPDFSCLNLFHFEGPGHNFDWGGGGEEPLRLYLADVLVQGTRHTLVVSMTEQDNPADVFASLDTAARHILSTMRLPG